MAKTIRYDIDIETRAALRGLDELDDAAAGFEDALDDTRTAGQRLADEIAAAAGAIETELDETIRIVAALDAELDGATNVDTKQAAQELRRLGASADDVEADAGELVAALRRVDDVKLKAVDAELEDVGRSLDTNVEGGSRRAHGAMSSMIGGTVGELPGISSALGPVGESLGQLAEGALDGEVNLANMAAAGAGIGATLFVFQQVTGHLKNIAAVKAFKAKQVEEYVDALDDAETGLDAILDKLNETRIATNLFGDEWELTELFNALGVDANAAARLIEGGTTAIDDWGAALRDAGVDSDSVGVAMHALRVEADAYSEAAEKAAITQQFLGERFDDTRSLDAATARLQGHADALGDVTDEADDTADAVDDVTDAFAELEEQLTERDAYLELLDTVDALAAAHATAASAATAGGAEAETAARKYEQAQIRAKQEVIALAGEIEGLPDEKVTQILTLIDEGAFTEVERRLASLERIRQVQVQVSTAGPSTYVPPASYAPEPSATPTPAPSIPPGVQLARASSSITNVYVGPGQTPADIDELLARSRARDGTG